MRAHLAALFLCLAFATPAAAHGRHAHHTRPHHVARRVSSLQGRHRPFKRASRVAGPAAAEPLVRAALRYEGAKRDPSGFRGEWCGDFLGFVAKQNGYRVPIGYRLARRWALAGPRIRPQPGAVMVMPHHVGLVMAVVGRFVELISGNHSHRVGVGLYPIARAIAFVQPVRG